MESWRNFLKEDANTGDPSFDRHPPQFDQIACPPRSGQAGPESTHIIGLLNYINTSIISGTSNTQDNAQESIAKILACLLTNSRALEDRDLILSMNPEEASQYKQEIQGQVSTEVSEILTVIYGIIIDLVFHDWVYNKIIVSPSRLNGLRKHIKTLKKSSSSAMTQVATQGYSSVHTLGYDATLGVIEKAALYRKARKDQDLETYLNNLESNSLEHLLKFIAGPEHAPKILQSLAKIENRKINEQEDDTKLKGIGTNMTEQLQAFLLGVLKNVVATVARLIVSFAAKLIPKGPMRSAAKLLTWLYFVYTVYNANQLHSKLYTNPEKAAKDCISETFDNIYCEIRSNT